MDDRSSLYSAAWGALDMYHEQQGLDSIAKGSAMCNEILGQCPGLGREHEECHQSYVTDALNRRPPEDYEGPHLPTPLTNEAVHDLVLHYAKGTGMHMHLNHLCTLLTRTMELLAGAPRVTRVQTRSGGHQTLVVVGDLHGQLQDLITIFLANGFPHPQGVQYVFNGDWVGRGECGVEVVAILFCYKLLYPESVHLIRGNHETRSVSQHYGFAQEVFRKYGNAHVHRLFCRVFDLLPVAAVIDDTAVVLHGGLPRSDAMDLEALEAVPREELKLEDRSGGMCALADLLWADPMPEPGRSPLSRAGHGVMLFGPNVTRGFLSRNRKSVLIRSHQVPSTNRGYEELHGGLCLTVFSASNYCGVTHNWGGVVVFTAPATSRSRSTWPPRCPSCCPRCGTRGRPLRPPPPHRTAARPGRWS